MILVSKPVAEQPSTMSGDPTRVIPLSKNDWSIVLVSSPIFVRSVDNKREKHLNRDLFFLLWEKLSRCAQTKREKQIER